ncbi:response regulator transcription factor [Duganella violaceipulchra]|uniref:DNA-binding response OmpR family regulator n=1 Tax=Duganella violaceipulchra TaxID=2849652 RepID=A0AA41LB23_9BURK|nr:response regulator transcription factor [Duganella violaceicalia]MBV6324865.1 response regulator transcription factor [Duganella violaceicalia]MCP2012191.1 DNA-binding response OmpR family regulator [Duganella violaceicalia]
MKALLVEDEQRIASFVCTGLREHGFLVDHCEDGNLGYDYALARDYDVVLLDVMVPGRDGLSILKAMRREGRNMPVILLTARNELDDRLTGLNLGADDYLAKPFYVEELVARIHALLRRVSGERQNVLTLGPLRLDRLSRVAEVNGRAVELTAREINLLEYLMRSPGRVYTRTQILEHVWGYDFEPQTNMVDVCIQRLRKKLELPDSVAIEAVRGVGYRLRKPDAPA